MMDLQAFQRFVDGLRAHDASLRAGLRALLVSADAQGRVERGLWASAVRRALESEGKVGRASMEVGAYLDEGVVGRLEGAGIVTRQPEGSHWTHLCWSPELWAELEPVRGAMLARLDEGPGAGVTPPPAPDLQGAPHPHAGKSRSLLKGVDLTKSFKGRAVVNQVNLEVEQGEIVGLLGPNGAGKTTTFYMIVGLIPPNSGRVVLDERDITRVPMYKRSRMGVGYLAQEPSVFRKLTVEDNVLAILETLGLPKRQRDARLEELLSELSLTHLRSNKAYALSGGERRRLEITRALVQDPKFILLDEPFAGIDPIAVNDIQQIVADLKTRGIGVIISDHNVEQTLDIVDRAYIMYEGRIRLSGTVSELVWNDEAAEIYLGPTLTQRMRSRYTPPPVGV